MFSTILRGVHGHTYIQSAPLNAILILFEGKKKNTNEHVCNLLVCESGVIVRFFLRPPVQRALHGGAQGSSGMGRERLLSFGILFALQLVPRAVAAQPAFSR